MLRCGRLRPVQAARPAPRLRITLCSNIGQWSARSMSTASRLKPRLPIDTPVGSAARAAPERAQSSRPRHQFKELNDEDLSLATGSNQKSDMDKHYERQETAELFDLDLPSAVAKEVERAGHASAPKSLSLPEVEMRLKQFLKAEEQGTDITNSAVAQRKVQTLKVLQSLQRMIRFAREHKIDPATNNAFLERLQQHLGFIGLNSDMEASIIAQEDSSFEDIAELEPLRVQKLFYVYAQELSEMSGVTLDGVVDPQGVPVNPAHLPKFTAADFQQAYAHFRRTGKILVSQRGEQIEMDPALSGVAPPSFEQLSLAFILRLAFLLRRLRSLNVAGDQFRTCFIIHATANVASLCTSLIVARPAVIEFQEYPGLLPQDVYTRLISLHVSMEDGDAAFELFEKCRRDHKGAAEPAAYHFALLALARDRKAQRKLLNEMDKLGMPPTEPVYEALVAGHLNAEDSTSAQETLLAGRREGFKLQQAHTYWIAQLMAEGADALSLFSTIRDLAKEDIVLDYDVLDQAYAAVKRSGLHAEAERLLQLRQEQYSEIPLPAELVKIPTDERVLRENATRLARDFSRAGRPLPPDAPLQGSQTTPVRNIDGELMEMRMETGGESVLKGLGKPSTEELQARKENPEWFSDETTGISPAVLASLSELPEDMAVKIRTLIDTTPPEQLADTMRVLVLDELDKFKEKTALAHEIEAVRGVLKRATFDEMASEEPLERDDFLAKMEAKGEINDEQVTQMRALLRLKAEADALKAKRAVHEQK